MRASKNDNPPSVNASTLLSSRMGLKILKHIRLEKQQKEVKNTDKRPDPAEMLDKFARSKKSREAFRQGLRTALVRADFDKFIANWKRARNLYSLNSQSGNLVSNREPMGENEHAGRFPIRFRNDSEAEKWFKNMTPKERGKIIEKAYIAKKADDKIKEVAKYDN